MFKIQGAWNCRSFRKNRNSDCDQNWIKINDTFSTSCEDIEEKDGQYQEKIQLNTICILRIWFQVVMKETLWCLFLADHLSVVS